MNENIENMENEAMENEELETIEVPEEDTEIVEMEDSGMTVGDWVKIGTIGVLVGGTVALGKKAMEWAIDKTWTFVERKVEQHRVNKAIRKSEKIVSDREPKEDKE